MVELSISKEKLEEIRKKDPQLTAMTNQWEQAFRGKVQVSTDANKNLIIRKSNG